MQYRAELTGARLTAITALLLGIATILGYMESVLMPTMPIPGFRLGLANIAVVLAIVLVGSSRAAVVSLGRVFLVGLATGSLGSPVTAMSFLGALSAWAVMSAMSKQGDRFSVIGWSVAGSATHGLAQLLTAVFLTGSAAPIMLLPLSLGLSLLSGLMIGLCAHLLLSRIPALSIPVRT